MRERADTGALVERVLRETLGVPAGAGEEAVDLALDAGASALAAAPGGWPATSRALLRAARAMLAQRWASGWDPADLVRLARRERPADRVRLTLDLIADDARRRPPAELPERWSAQLAALQARVWWQGGAAGYLEAHAQRERVGRFEAARCALDALRFVGRLPPLPPVGPPPGPHAGPGGGPRAAGAADRATHPGPGRRVDPRFLERVRALLAKAESTEFPEEAEALSAKAQQLMARHSIDEALLAAGDPAGPGGPGAAPDGPRACRIGVEGPYESAKALLLDAVAEANRCHAVWSAEFAFSTVVGYAADLELVELLHTSLLVQGTTAMHRAGDRHHAGGRARRTRDFRESFLIAYAGRVRERLATAARLAEREATDEAARTSAADPLPVLAARDVSVGETAERMFPRTVAHRLRGRDAHGWASGLAAADEARLR
ncbi:DUF2786 domain-containing protein [Streptomyces sp. NPDC057702]|uniref:DUF2786 domain-containing protein n=1 Tax=unclassified Streptomyces TaxID=2593676 RepID=UPI003698512B